MFEESIIVSELVKGSGRYFTASQNSVPDQRLSGRLFGCLFFILKEKKTMQNQTKKK